MIRTNWSFLTKKVIKPMEAKRMTIRKSQLFVQKAIEKCTNPNPVKQARTRALEESGKVVLELKFCTISPELSGGGGCVGEVDEEVIDSVLLSGSSESRRSRKLAVVLQRNTSRFKQFEMYL